MNNKLFIGIIVLVAIFVYLIVLSFLPAKPEVKGVSINSCIITIFNDQYDVVELLKDQTNVDFYKCDKNMTNEYMSKFGPDTTQLLKYKVN